MTRGVRLYLVGSFVLVSLAGCGRGLFQSAEREPWRAEAEVACLKSGAVKEDPGTGPDRPDFRSRRLWRAIPAQGRSPRRGQPAVSVLPMKLRPPGKYRQPAALAGPAGAGRRTVADLFRYGAAPAELWRAVQRTDLADRARRGPAGRRNRSAGRRRAAIARPARRRLLHGRACPIRRATVTRHPPPLIRRPPIRRRRAAAPSPRLGPTLGDPVNAVGPVTIKPTATLACPIVSVLDRWLAEFGAAGRSALVRRARGRDQADLRLFLPRHERQSERAYFRTRFRQRARYRLLHAGRWQARDGEGRLARHAGRAGLSARRAGLRLPAVQHRAGAGLQPSSRGPHPRRSDAPLQRAA